MFKRTLAMATVSVAVMISMGCCCRRGAAVSNMAPCCGAVPTGGIAIPAVPAAPAPVQAGYAPVAPCPTCLGR